MEIFEKATRATLEWEWPAITYESGVDWGQRVEYSAPATLSQVERFRCPQNISVAPLWK